MQSFEYKMLPEWIKQSELVCSLDKDEPIELPSDLIIPDVLTNESLEIVFNSITYFGCNPSNFLEYIKNTKIKELINLKEKYSDNELNYINILVTFKLLNKNQLCIWAVKNGYLDILKYGRENEYYWDKCIYSEAAINGYLDCLKFLHENGCPWDKKTCEIAVKNRDFNCLEYAFKNGCPWEK